MNPSDPGSTPPEKRVINTLSPTFARGVSSGPFQQSGPISTTNPCVSQVAELIATSAVTWMRDCFSASSNALSSTAFPTGRYPELFSTFTSFLLIQLICIYIDYLLQRPQCSNSAGIGSGADVRVLTVEPPLRPLLLQLRYPSVQVVPERPSRRRCFHLHQLFLIYHRLHLPSSLLSSDS